MSTGRITYTVRMRRRLVHLQGRGDRPRCGKAPPPCSPPLRIVATEELGVTCRMCLRCKDTDAGLRYTR